METVEVVFNGKTYSFCPEVLMSNVKGYAPHIVRQWVAHKILTEPERFNMCGYVFDISEVDRRYSKKWGVNHCGTQYCVSGFTMLSQGMCKTPQEYEAIFNDYDSELCDEENLWSANVLGMDWRTAYKLFMAVNSTRYQLVEMLLNAEYVNETGR